MLLGQNFDLRYPRAPHWCPIPFTDITAVHMRDEPFQVHRDYNPHNTKYARARCRVR